VLRLGTGVDLPVLAHPEVGNLPFRSRVHTGAGRMLSVLPRWAGQLHGGHARQTLTVTPSCISMTFSNLRSR
jgi:hypothetical protein